MTNEKMNGQIKLTVFIAICRYNISSTSMRELHMLINHLPIKDLQTTMGTLSYVKILNEVVNRLNDNKGDTFFHTSKQRCNK